MKVSKQYKQLVLLALEHEFSTKKLMHIYIYIYIDDVALIIKSIIYLKTWRKSSIIGWFPFILKVQPAAK